MIEPFSKPTVIVFAIVGVLAVFAWRATLEYSTEYLKVKPRAPESDASPPFDPLADELGALAEVEEALARSRAEAANLEPRPLTGRLGANIAVGYDHEAGALKRLWIRATDWRLRTVGFVHEAREFMFDPDVPGRLHQWDHVSDDWGTSWRRRPGLDPTFHIAQLLAVGSDGRVLIDTGRLREYAESGWRYVDGIEGTVTSAVYLADGRCSS